jgi:hypothetical protein
MSSDKNTKYYTTSINIENFKGLKYSNNSCYIDSVLVSLFAPDNNGDVLKNLLLCNIQEDNRHNVCCSNLDISKNIRTLIQKELSNIYLTLNNSKNYNVENVDKLRQLFKYCGHSENYGNTGMKDPAEFISYIFDLFNISCIKSQNVYGVSNSNKLKLLDKSIDNNGSIVITHILNSEISLEKLITQNEYNSINFNRDNNNFIGTFTIIEVVKSPFIIFHIQRTTLSKYFNTNKVKTPNHFSLNKIKYNLSAVIVFNSNHYTAFLKKGGEWYYYDDMSEMLVKHYDNFQIESRGVLYFYY